MREETFSKKKRSQKNKETLKRWIKLKEMLEQMKAKGDENRMKGKEDERKRAIEKHFFFWRIEQESDSNGRFQKEGTKIENEKKKKNGETENKEDIWKNINNDIFFKNQMVSKKEEIQNRCETQFKIQNNPFSKINLFVGEKRSQQKESKKKKKTSGNFNTKGFFLFEKFEKHEIGGAKGDKKKRRHETI